MILDIVKRSGVMWREIARLAMPQDASINVVYGTTPKSKAPFDAYTDNKRIFININDEAKIQSDLERIVVPAYVNDAPSLYGVAHHISRKALLENLCLDAFLFVHFHEELHPRLCPTDKADQRNIAVAIYEGMRAAEPTASRADTLRKVNNSKNLIWDTVLNVSFMQQASDAHEALAQKTRFVFEKRQREIEGQRIIRFPFGTVPIIYMMSAANRTTDVPISLMGALYASMSYNAVDVRQRSLAIFFKDLARKNIADPMKVLQTMYKGFTTYTPDALLKPLGLARGEFATRVALIDDLTNPAYEQNQAYLHHALTMMFDNTETRYATLKGLAKFLCEYISRDRKVGSPDGATSGSGDPDEETPDSMGNTLDDLLDGLDPDEADTLAEEAANEGDGTGGRGKPLTPMAAMAADEYYKRNAEPLELRNPTKKDISVDLGPRKRWKLQRSDTLSGAQVAQLNHKAIMTFQQATRLPVLMEGSKGVFRVNQYILLETRSKSYTSQLSGIELPQNWVLLQDSSGSMGGQNYVGTKCKFDLLNLVKYGLMKGLYDACKTMGKDLRFGVVDFSDKTRYAGIDSLINVYDARHHPIKDVSLSPQCGDTMLDLDVFTKIRKDLAPGKTIYTLITDGALENDPASVVAAVQHVVQKDAAFVFVEIGVRSTLGGLIEDASKTNPAVLYRPVRNIKAIKEKLGSVLVKYS